MRRVHVVARICARASLAIMLGCGSDPIGPSGERPNSVSFSYTGVRQGIYVAEGTPLSINRGCAACGENIARSDYAAAVSYTNEVGRAGTVSLIANDTAGRSYGNFLLLPNIPARKATIPITISASGAFFIGLKWDLGNFGADTTYFLESGSLTVTDYSAERIRGTFQGTAYEFVGFMFNRQRSITVSNGRFDIAIGDTSAAFFRCRLFSCPSP